AGAVSSRPIEGPDTGMNITAVPATNRDSHEPPPWAGWRIVSPGYFHAVGLPLLRGRTFDERDTAIEPDRRQPASPRRVMISQRLAKFLFADQDAIGKHVALWNNGDLNAEVIGIVGNSLERGPASGPTLNVYLPYLRNGLVSEFVLHTRGNP